MYVYIFTSGFAIGHDSTNHVTPLNLQRPAGDVYLMPIVNKLGLHQDCTKQSQAGHHIQSGSVQFNKLNIFFFFFFFFFFWNFSF